MAEGFKAWTASEVLDAEDLNDYASSQAVMRFANAAGRDASLNVSVVKEGMLAYLKDTNVLTVNTDGSTTGWIQVFPVVTASIQDGNVTNAKLAANSVNSSNIVNGSITPGDLAGGNYAINITGSSATVGGYSPALDDTPNTVALRDLNSAVEAGAFIATDSSGQFQSTATYTYVGNNCARVLNSSDVYGQAVTGRTVLVNVNGTLGTSSSSVRFKENIEPLPYLPADILKIRPITFRYQADHLEEDSERPVEVGLIAEEVAELGFEELIYRDKENQAEGIAYEKLAVLLVKVCQDQQTQLDALSARLEKLGG
jgi:hypothetical protein